MNESASSADPDEVAGVDVPIVWQGRRAIAFVPHLLADRDLTLSAGTVARVAAAAAETALTAASMPADYAPLARLLLRAEGVASSYIEGVAAPVVDVVLAEDADEVRSTPAGWVAANHAAITEAVASATEGELTIAVLCGWHRTIMAGSPLPGRYVGVIRDEQGWIGGSSPLDAAFVTPPPDRLPALLDDLIAYVNRTDIEPVAQAAIAHAQFELIHPFGDGNGRLGRVLVTWLLTRRLALVTPPPVSIRIAADRGGYLSGLTLFRLGRHETWVRWFAEVVTGAGAVQRGLVAAVESLMLRWREQLGVRRGARRVRSDALAWRVLDILPRRLVVTSAAVAAELGATERSARHALGELVDAGILTEHVLAGPRSGGRPPHRFISVELLELAGSTAI